MRARAVTLLCAPDISRAQPSHSPTPNLVPNLVPNLAPGPARN